MIHNRIITENQLDEWVRGNAQQAQGTIVELVLRLVAVSSPKPTERRFPLGDSIGQPGPDGFMNTEFAFNPFVPEGRSFWEIGTGIKAGDKATSDYRDLTGGTPAAIRQESTFIFVTPLSGRRDWEHTWKEGAQAGWLQDRRQRHDWSDVHVLDGSHLIDWLSHFPAVERWLAHTMGIPVHELETPEQRWADLRTIGDPPPLTPDVFLANRGEACNKLNELFSQATLQLRLDTRYPDQMADFVAAYVAAMDDDERVDVVGRCLIISGAEGWNALTSLRQAHILVADFDIDDGAAGTRLLEKARRAGHAVIFSGTPGGIPHPNRVPMPEPKHHQVKEALEKAGYPDERARVLAQKSNGNLGSLLRCLQNLSLSPAWAQGTDAARLVIAELLGAWNERCEADKAAVENLSGNAYGEWIGTMRDVALRPGTPLIQREGTWKFVARYEGWYALGRHLFDDHLDRMRDTAVRVLRERDPQFDLPPNQRFAASIHGKVLTHSHVLRHGLAESLALLGSHPGALVSCSPGKAETTAILAVRDILAEADWVLWASLNHLLPLLAEAAPGEFLDAVESALTSSPCPFDTIFAQESSALTGSNHMAGLLWALETLAWGAEYLIRVVVVLGELAARDPGGNTGNRPANSLSGILLPWLPQTCAPLTQRRAAVRTLLRDVQGVGWKLLLDLLPSSHQMSLGSRRPAWRELIPADCTRRVTHREYEEQIAAYAELAVQMAADKVPKLVSLIKRLDDLPPVPRSQLLTVLSSATVISMPDTDRTRLWTELVDFVSKHRRFTDAEWAVPAGEVDEIAVIAERLAPDSPGYRHRRLFSERDFDLYEEHGSYQEQQKQLEARRQRAISEVFAAGGMHVVLGFAQAIESPGRAGFAFGVVAPDSVDEAILPTLLESEIPSLSQFAGGFVWGRFRTRGWAWIDAIDTSTWPPSATGQLLAYLPFVPETWQRSAQLLGADEAPYWTKTHANPYEADAGIDWAIDRLVEHGRANAAVRCIERLQHNHQPVDSGHAVRVLQAVLNSHEDAHAMSVYAVVEIIKMLQEDPETNPDDLFRIEWAFLPLLDRHHGAFPKLIEQRLADEPSLFCEVIQTGFRSKKEEHHVKEPTEHQTSIAQSAYRLLRQWRTPPGQQKNGSYDGDALKAWLKEVRAACVDSGHLEVALTMVGHVLIHVPPDPDGLWLHHAAAEALNASDAKDMRDGFQSELFNTRGVHSWTAGREEHEFAARYRAQADAIEVHGYHRLANSLRNLAAAYERDAEREASRDPFDD